MVVTFDTLKASRQLQQAGFDEAKADALVSIFAGDVGASLATKADIAEVRAEVKAVRAYVEDLDVKVKDLDVKVEALDVKVEGLKADVEGLKADVKAVDVKVEAVRTDMKHEISSLGQRLTIRMGAIAAVVVGLVFAGMGVITSIILAAP